MASGREEGQDDSSARVDISKLQVFNEGGLNTHGSDLCHWPVDVEIQIPGPKLDRNLSLSESFNSLKMLRTPSSESMSVLMSPYASSLSGGKGIPSRVDRLLAQRSAQMGVVYKHDLTSPVHHNEHFRPNNLPRMDSREGFVSTSPLLTRDDDLSQRKLIIVANRLPVRLSKCENGSWNFVYSSGGLVSALLGINQPYETVWIGWLGQEVSCESDQQELKDKLKEKGCIPVFLDSETAELHYNGFSNNILWSLFHYIPLSCESKLSSTKTHQKQWEGYQRANKLFAEAVKDVYKSGDIVWLHDYHLMCVPRYLKDADPDMRVGWFLHTPFPSSEIFRTLPARCEILKSLLRADLIGCHTYDYARHFVSSCTRLLGLEGTPEGVEDRGKTIRVAAFPIGIDLGRFSAALKTESVTQRISALQERFNGKIVLLGVDRLDIIKGIPQKLLAFEKFLEDNPSWREKVLLIQIAVPTRTTVDEYIKLTSEVHEIVGRVNGRFGTLSSVPIHHLDRSLDFEELCALYAITDIAIVTSLRDGMNLVSYEYVACQENKNGVLILSEFAGAAQSLGAGAILVNPWNIDDMAMAIKAALNMDEDEKEKRHEQNYRYISTHTAQSWAETFVSELNDTQVEAQLRKSEMVKLLPVDEVVSIFKTSKKKLIIMGYNTTCKVYSKEDCAKSFDIITEDESQANKGVLESIRLLSNDSSNRVLIMTGSSTEKMDRVFGDMAIWVAAENGIYLSSPPTEIGCLKREWEAMEEVENMDVMWKEHIKLVFDYFHERTPRSFVECREFSLVWNYKYSDLEFGRLQAKDLLQHLLASPLSNSHIDVIQGYRSVEVRPAGMSKGSYIDRILKRIDEADSYQSSSHPRPFDFVFVGGYFMNRDEDLYTYFRSALCSPQIRQGQDRTLSSHDYDDSLRIESLNHMDQALMTIRHAKRPHLLKDIFNLLYTMDVNVVSVNSRTEAERVLCELQLESGGGGIDDDKILQIKKAVVPLLSSCSDGLERNGSFPKYNVAEFVEGGGTTTYHDFSCVIGPRLYTRAQYYCDSSKDIHNLLKLLSC